MLECQEATTSSEFTEWLGYYDAYPWDMGFALLAALLGNIHRDKKTKPTPFGLSDFVPGMQIADDEDPGEVIFAKLGRVKRHGQRRDDHNQRSS